MHSFLPVCTSSMYKFYILVLVTFTSYRYYLYVLVVCTSCMFQLYVCVLVMCTSCMVSLLVVFSSCTGTLWLFLRDRLTYSDQHVTSAN